MILRKDWESIRSTSYWWQWSSHTSLEWYKKGESTVMRMGYRRLVRASFSSFWHKTCLSSDAIAFFFLYDILVMNEWSFFVLFVLTFLFVSCLLWLYCFVCFSYICKSLFHSFTHLLMTGRCSHPFYCPNHYYSI